MISVRSEVQIFPGPPRRRTGIKRTQNRPVRRCAGGLPGAGLCRLSSVLVDRGRSSAGRAPALQAGGHRFDPGRLHQEPMGLDACGSAWRYEIGRGRSSEVLSSDLRPLSFAVWHCEEEYDWLRPVVCRERASFWDARWRGRMGVARRVKHEC